MLKHSAAARGKRILIVLRDGTRITAKFVDRGNGWVLVEGHPRIKMETMRCFTILR